ncbi:hypothetical protein FRC07_001784 [Ceratobasidium sp. 392]|nr:hypothetical protein FRC07_001784 [Ceratobasidium sp. 392]
MSNSMRKLPSENDFPPTAFFAVYRGHKTGVFPTYAQLMKNIENYTAAIWNVFNNKAHAENFAKTGVVPNGVTPVQPGAHSTPGSRRTTSLISSSSAPRFAIPASRTAGLAVGGTKSMSALAGTSTPAPAPKLAPTKSTPVFNDSPTRAGRPSAAAPTDLERPVAGSSRSNPVSVTTSMSSMSSRTTSASTQNTDPELEDEDKAEVWTDGSCLDNGKPNARAAYGVYFGEGDPRNEAKRVPGVQTNNRGEILGVIRALEIVSESVSDLTIYTDSQYTIKCCQEWLPGWIRSGGVKKDGKKVANFSMLRYLDARLRRRGDRVKLIHVAAHKDNVGNNAADELAKRAAGGNSAIPPDVDWDIKRYDLEKNPAPVKQGAPVITSVPLSSASQPSPKRAVAKGSIARALQKTQPPAASDSDEFPEYDDEFPDIDESAWSDLPQPTAPPPAPKPAPAPKTSQGKRGRGTTSGTGVEDEEIEDSETERKAKIKAGKRRRVKCPSCTHEFAI